jgi:hypothetical protein
VLGDAVVEGTEGTEILPRVFETIDEVEVGLAGFLMQNIVVMLDLDPPNVKLCKSLGLAACPPASHGDALCMTLVLAILLTHRTRSLASSSPENK